MRELGLNERLLEALAQQLPPLAQFPLLLSVVSEALTCLRFQVSRPHPGGCLLADTICEHTGLLCHSSPLGVASS